METPSRKSEATLGRLVSLVSGAVGPPPPGPSVKARSDGRRRVLVASDPRYARKKPSEGRLLRPPRTGQPERGSPPSPVVGYAWVIRYYGITVLRSSPFFGPRSGQEYLWASGGEDDTLRRYAKVFGRDSRRPETKRDGAQVDGLFF